MREHADQLEQQREQHGPDEATVGLSLTDDVFLRSDNLARWQLGILLPVEGGPIVEHPGLHRGPNALSLGFAFRRGR